MSTDRERIAYHEAGHAVFAWTYGIEMEEVTIAGTEEHAGRVRLADFDEEGLYLDAPYEGTPEYALMSAQAEAVLAGELAVEILTGEPIDWSEWSETEGADVRLYQDYAIRLGWYDYDGPVLDLTGEMEEAEGRVRTMLRVRWPAVEALATALQERDTLPGPEAVAIIEASGVPAPVASVYADVRREQEEEEAARARWR